jgi:hypothetical protein
MRIELVFEAMDSDHIEFSCIPSLVWQGLSSGDDSHNQVIFSTDSSL